MRRPSRVAVGIPSWNGRHHLEICLEALAAQRPPGMPWEVWVLDNGSTDGTGEWLARHHPAVRVLASPVNLGFAAAANRLVEESGADAVALLNNDTRPASSWLQALVQALAEQPDEVAAVSGRIVDWAGERLDFGRGVMTFDGHAFQLDYRRPLSAARMPGRGEELLFACGGNMLVRREAFQAVGRFDESFFAYYEDVDLGWRLWAAGYRVVAEPEAVVHHRSMATSDLLGLYDRGFLFERNAFATAYKNFDLDHWRALEPAILLTLLSRTETLMAEHNPGGGALREDPYRSPSSAAMPTSPGFDRERPAEGLWARMRRHGLREASRRAVRKLGRRLAGEGGASGAVGPGATPATPILSDPRTVAQWRAVASVLGSLDLLAGERDRVQERRRRSDREIFERFPLWLVPTYPGDERLFASRGFVSWLPPEVPMVRARLGEVIETGEP
jgi:GT2 family glycosyltransferase